MYREGIFSGRDFSVLGSSIRPGISPAVVETVEFEFVTVVFRHQVVQSGKFERDGRLIVFQAHLSRIEHIDTAETGQLRYRRVVDFNGREIDRRLVKILINVLRMKRNPRVLTSDNEGRSRLTCSQTGSFVYFGQRKSVSEMIVDAAAVGC